VEAGHTFGMKVAVSIPDDVFKEAEKVAKKQKTSRSQLYSLALREYLARQRDDEITEAWNRVIDEVGEEADPFTNEAARRTLKRSEWQQ
jgi:metal-responsive CopG/Arc/MetJ family transcriptional regulator